MNRENGAQLLARQTLSSDIWVTKPAWWFKVWCYLILSVTYGEHEKIKRGTGFFTYAQIIKEAHLRHDNINSLSNVMEWLKQTRQITTQKTTRGMLITVVKYEYFQDTGTYRNKTKNNTENKLRTRQEQDYIYNKDNKENNTVGEVKALPPKGVVDFELNKELEPNEDRERGAAAARILKAFSAEYNRVKGIRLVVAWGKDNGRIKNALKSITEEDFMKAIPNFFKLKGEWIESTDYGVGVFLVNLNKALLLKDKPKPSYMLSIEEQDELERRKNAGL